MKPLTYCLEPEQITEHIAHAGSYIAKKSSSRGNTTITVLCLMLLFGAGFLFVFFRFIKNPEGAFFWGVAICLICCLFFVQRYYERYYRRIRQSAGNGVTVHAHRIEDRLSLEGDGISTIINLGEQLVLTDSKSLSILWIDPIYSFAFPKHVAAELGLQQYQQESK